MALLRGELDAAVTCPPPTNQKPTRVTLRIHATSNPSNSTWSRTLTISMYDITMDTCGIHMPSKVRTCHRGATAGAPRPISRSAGAEGRGRTRSGGPVHSYGQEREEAHQSNDHADNGPKRYVPHAARIGLMQAVLVAKGVDLFEVVRARVGGHANRPAEQTPPAAAQHRSQFTVLCLGPPQLSPPAHATAHPCIHDTLLDILHAVCCPFDHD